uniref:Putative secreted protein n=1 Tax=Anopheles marajoara TaxID=58244 RepID=A0A2M4C7W2_9DIPT
MTNVLFVVVASAAAAVTDCGRRGQLRWSIAEHSRRNPYNTERDHLAEGFPVVADKFRFPRYSSLSEGMHKQMVLVDRTETLTNHRSTAGCEGLPVTQIVRKIPMSRNLYCTAQL